VQYLNSGAGGIGGIYLHHRYADDPPAHFHGWFSNSTDTKFNMAEKVDLAKGADSFRLCNPPPWLAALNMASLEVLLCR
jgi:kynureninase